MENETSLEVFEMMKFDKIAVEPISGRKENIIDVINQLHIYLFSIMAT